MLFSFYIYFMPIYRSLAAILPRIVNSTLRAGWRQVLLRKLYSCRYRILSSSYWGSATRCFCHWAHI